MGRWAVWCLLLLCLVACHRQPKVTAKPAEKASEEEMLRRIDEVKKWGFADGAEKLYQRLTLTGKGDARYAAFERLLALLQERNKEDEMIAVQEQMLSAFPERAGYLRSQLAAHYIQVWDWTRARRMLVECQARANDIERRELGDKIAWIEAWEKRPTVWQENFSKRKDDWQLAHPFFCKQETSERYFEAVVITGSWCHAGKEFHWHGGSFSLKWDMRVKTIQWLGAIEFGLFSPADLPGLVARFSCNGGTGDYHYTMGIQFVDKSRDRRLRNMLPEYAPDTWYTIELSYLQNIRQACLRVWKQQGMVLLGEEIVQLASAFTAGDYMIGFAPARKGNPSETSALSEVIIDDIELRGGEWKECQEKWPLAHIYRVNKKALEEPLPAFQECTSLLQQQAEDKQDWRLVEIRSYLFCLLKENKKAAAELQRLLQLYPGHPNKDYFHRLLAEYMKREN